MDDDTTCKKCGEDYDLRGGCDPTDVCDSCAQEIAAKAIAFATAYDTRPLNGRVEDGDAVNEALLAVVKAARLPVAARGLSLNGLLATLARMKLNWCVRNVASSAFKATIFSPIREFVGYGTTMEEALLGALEEAEEKAPKS